MEKFESLFQDEKYDVIIDEIKKIKKEELTSEILSYLGKTYIAISEYRQAIDVLKGIEAEEGKSFLWNYRIGSAYFFENEYENAITYFLKAFSIKPEAEGTKEYLLRSYISLAELKEDENEIEIAIKYAFEARKYVETLEDKIYCESNIAWILNKISRWEEAKELLEYVLQLGRNDDWIYSELGYCLGEMKEYKKSLEYYLKAVEVGRNDIWICSQIAWTYGVIKDFQKSLEWYFKANDLGRNDKWINIQIGLCHRALGDFEMALKNYLLAYELDKGKDIFLISEIAWTYRALGKYSEALEYLEIVEKLGRKDIWLYSEKAAIEFEIGEYEESLKNLKKAEELGRKDKWLFFMMSENLKKIKG